MNIISQLHSNRLRIFIILFISAFLASLVLLVWFLEGVPISNLTRDPVAIVEVPFYTGFFSQLGIFFWAATATLCFFSAKMTSNRPESRMFKRYLFLSGLLTLFLGLDDIFLFHELVFPIYLGIPQQVVFIIYGILVLSFLLKFYSVILNTEYILLITAFFFFGLSVSLDLFHLPNVNPFFFEDGCKMAGIVSWVFYSYCNAVMAVTKHKDDASNFQKHSQFKSVNENTHHW